VVVYDPLALLLLLSSFSLVLCRRLSERRCHRPLGIAMPLPPLSPLFFSLPFFIFRTWPRILLIRGMATLSRSARPFFSFFFFFLPPAPRRKKQGIIGGACPPFLSFFPSPPPFFSPQLRGMAPQGRTLLFTRYGPVPLTSPPFSLFLPFPGQQLLLSSAKLPAVLPFSPPPLFSPSSFPTTRRFAAVHGVACSATISYRPPFFFPFLFPPPSFFFSSNALISLTTTWRWMGRSSSFPFLFFSPFPPGQLR